jgi:hypothetical protein
MNNLQKNGLRNLDGLARVDAEARRRMYEQNQIESEAKNEAIGSLIGNVAGLGMAGYSEYKKGEFGKDVTNAEAARNQFPDEKSYQESLKKNYSPKVQKEVAWRRTHPGDGRDAMGLDDATPEWSKKTSVTANRDAQGNALPASTWAPPPSTADRQVVFAKSPMRSRLTSVWSDTTDEFKTAFNSLLSGFPSNIIG